MTQDEIIELARQAGFVVTYIGDPIGTNYAMIEAFAKLVAAKEREACAQLAVDAIAFNGGTVQMESHVRQAIEARDEA